MKIIFTGDVYIRKAGVRPQPELQKIFKEADQVVINLEGPVVSRSSAPAKKAGPTLCQHTEAIRSLCQSLAVTVIGGANNHIMDYGSDGLEHTRSFAQSLGIKAIGFGDDFEKDQIVILAAAEEEFGAAHNTRKGFSSLYSDELLDRIRTESAQGRVVIVYAHGGVELAPLPTKYIQDRFRSCIDAGAEAVIGHHPHVAQGIERYRNKTIIYSLGNFIHELYPRSWGLLAEATFTKGESLKIKLIPIHFENNEIGLVANPAQYLKVIEKLGSIYENDQAFAQMAQTQAAHLVQEYRSYFHRLFEPQISWRRYLINWLTRKTATVSQEKNEWDERLLYHLFHNRSHREVIETGLAVVTGEAPRVITKESNDEFARLKNYLTHGPS